MGGPARSATRSVAGGGEGMKAVDWRLTMFSMHGKRGGLPSQNHTRSYCTFHRRARPSLSKTGHDFDRMVLRNHR